MTAGLTPLEEIERLVQARARQISADLADEATEKLLAQFVDEEIRSWNDDFRRGTRPFRITDPRLLAERAMRNLTGYGPLGPLLADDDVWEIMVNRPDAIFVKRHRGPSGYHHEVFHDDEHVLRILTKVLDDSSGAHRKLDPAEGLQDAQLDNGARLHIIHGDIARGGHVMVNIRKFTGVAFRSLDELVGRGTMSSAAADFLRACVKARQTIVFAGVPGSGKTTMLSCCCAELDPSLRVVLAEEVFEADIPLANVAGMQTRAARPDRPAIDLRRLVAGFLRMAPDVAIVGEVRDREALPLMLTLSSGVKGYTTIHAGSARQALTRLRFICQLSDTSNELPMAALNSLVSEAVDVVVHSVRTHEGPRVSGIVCVEDFAGTADSTQFTVTEVFTRPQIDGPLQWSGLIPTRVAGALASAGMDMRSVLNADPIAGDSPDPTTGPPGFGVPAPRHTDTAADRPVPIADSPNLGAHAPLRSPNLGMEATRP